MLIVMSVSFITSCGSDDKSVNTPEYVGRWCMDGLLNNGSEYVLQVFDFQNNSLKSTFYYLTGKNINFTSLGELYTAQKEEEYGTVSDNNGIVTIADKDGFHDYKYSVINNQLILTEVETGRVICMYKVIDEIQQVVDNIDKISVYENGLIERVEKKYIK